MKIQNLSFIFVLVLLPLILSPIVLLIGESFISDTGTLSFTSISHILLSNRQQGLFLNSVTLAGGAALLSLFIGVPYAYIITRTNVPLRKLWSIVYLFPFLTPPYMQAIIWTKLLAPGYLIATDTMPSALSSIFSIPGGIFVFSLSLFPIVILLVSSGLKNLNNSLEEAAMQSQGRFSSFVKITLPLVFPHILTSGIIVFIFTLANFEVADILRLTVYPMEIFINFSAFYDEKAATILSFPIMVISFLLILALTLYLKGKNFSLLEWSFSPQLTMRLGKYKFACLFYSFLVITISVLLPLVIMIKGAGPPKVYISALSETKGTIWYSLGISALSSLVMIIFCFLTAYYLERSKGFTRNCINFLILLPLGVPSIVLGIGLIRVWNRPFLDWVYQGPIILILGCLAAYTPFIIWAITPSLKQIHKSMEEVALQKTSNPIDLLGKILLPLTMKGIITSFILGFVFFIGNLGMTLLIVAPGKSTIPITIYNYLHYGGENTVFALCLILVVFISIALILLWVIGKSTVTRKGIYD